MNIRDGGAKLIADVLRKNTVILILIILILWTFYDFLVDIRVSRSYW